MDRQADERGDGGNDGGADQRSDAFLDDADPDELEEMEDCLLHTIRQGLFLGSMQAEANLEAMRAKGVTHVLQVRARRGDAARLLEGGCVSCHSWETEYSNNCT